MARESVGLNYWTSRSGLPGNGERCRTVVRLLLINLNQVALKDYLLNTTMVFEFDFTLPSSPNAYRKACGDKSKVKLKDYYKQ